MTILAVTTPILVGLIFNVEALGAFLAGVILTGQLLAVYMAIAGGAMDNAKKYIEDGHLGGKGSEAHKAAVVGDTVGDPLKDTAGPALNPMIKVVNLISLIAGPVIIKLQGNTIAIAVTVVVFAALFIWSIIQSKGDVAVPVELEAS